MIRMFIAEGVGARQCEKPRKLRRIRDVMDSDMDNCQCSRPRITCPRNGCGSSLMARGWLAFVESKRGTLTKRAACSLIARKEKTTVEAVEQAIKRLKRRADVEVATK